MEGSGLSMAGKALPYAAMLLAVQWLPGCSGEESRPTPSANEAAALPADTTDEPIILAFGDSLYAGYGLEPREGFVPELERALEAQGHAVRVHNAGVSGDTSEAGRQRLAFTLDGLPRKPVLALVGLGGNDMLRGLDPARTRTNLEAILAEFDRRDIPVILTGMRAAPNMGRDFVARFDSIYSELARESGAGLDPFFLQGVVTDPALMQADRIHPNAAGVDLIVARVAPLVASELAKGG
jgi:acyl-CoA thioesterase-1